MATSEDGYFDEAVAAHYDDAESEMFDPAVVEATVDFLAELAGSGRALELGIGTGRIAVSLAQRGVPVHGIDLSKAMVARLREKPGAEKIGVTIGDFATTTVDGTFSVAYLVFNTISNLTTQEAQVACFRNVAAHLEPGGCFVVEVGVGGGEPLRVFDFTDTHVGIDEYDAAACLPPLRARGRALATALDSVPLGLARGARPHGGARRDAPPRALERLEAQPFTSE